MSKNQWRSTHGWIGFTGDLKAHNLEIMSASNKLIYKSGMNALYRIHKYIYGTHFIKKWTGHLLKAIGVM